MEKMLLSGNEAVARGAYEAGCHVGVGYPGTPSTEILENVSRDYKGIKTEWSVNEKVALEVGLGAAWAGARTLVTMKHVGVNVAADPLFTASYIGTNAGIVVITADDPAMHSSQNEQDNRHYARSAKLPMLEPSDSQEVVNFTKLAFEMSEQFDTPVFLRMTTRLSHSMGTIIPEERGEKEITGFQPDTQKYVMIPAYARGRHVVVEDRMEKIAEAAETLEINKIERNSSKVGIITSGIPYTYVKEAYPEASILKLGMVHPLPKNMIREFCESVDEVIIVEELDPFFEDQLRAMGLKVGGKDRLPILGEFSPELIREKLKGEKAEITKKPELALPPRPPGLCAGCPHAHVFNILRDMEVTVTGDIGCYTLGVLPPYSALHTCVDMGASLTVAQGMEMAMGPESAKDIVAVIGDSTFAHSGVTGLINAAYNKRNGLMIVLDNATTAMTGMQPNPMTGETINYDDTVILDYKKLGEAAGLDPENILIVDAYKKKDLEVAIQKLRDSGKLSLLIAQGLCVIERKNLRKSGKLQCKVDFRKERLDSVQ